VKIFVIRVVVVGSKWKENRQGRKCLRMELMRENSERDISGREIWGTQFLLVHLV